MAKHKIWDFRWGSASQNTWWKEEGPRSFTPAQAGDMLGRIQSVLGPGSYTFWDGAYGEGLYEGDLDWVQANLTTHTGDVCVDVHGGYYCLAWGTHQGMPYVIWSGMGDPLASAPSYFMVRKKDAAAWLKLCPDFAGVKE